MTLRWTALRWGNGRARNFRWTARMEPLQGLGWRPTAKMEPRHWRRYPTNCRGGTRIRSPLQHGKSRHWRGLLQRRPWRELQKLARALTENQRQELARASIEHEELVSEIQVGLMEAQSCWGVKPLACWAAEPPGCLAIGQDGDEVNASSFEASAHIIDGWSCQKASKPEASQRWNYNWKEISRPEASQC